MHRVRGASFFIVVAIASLFIRSLASLGQPVARFPDSLGYEHLSLWGDIDRFWPVPVVYSLFQSDTSRVVIHILIGVGAWIWLGLVVSRLTRWPRVSFALICILGLTPQVIRYDVAILSESLGISFAVGALAASLSVYESPTQRRCVIWVTAIALCAMTRPAHLIVLAVAFLSYLISPVITERRLFSTQYLARRIVSPISLSLIALGIFGVVQLQSNNSTSLLNFYTVLSERVITNDDRYNWFVTHGMPDIEGAREALGYDYREQLPDDVANIVQLPIGQQPPTLMRVGGTSLAQWAQAQGWSTYVRYVITHPVDTSERLSALLNETLNPSNPSFFPLENGPMLPWWLFSPWQLWFILAIAGISMLVAYRQRQLTALFLVISSIVVLVYATTTLTSGIEHQRHGVTVAVVLRLLGIVAPLVALSQEKQRRMRRR